MKISVFIAALSLLFFLPAMAAKQEQKKPSNLCFSHYDTNGRGMVTCGVKDKTLTNYEYRGKKLPKKNYRVQIFDRTFPSGSGIIVLNNPVNYCITSSPPERGGCVVCTTCKPNTNLPFDRPWACEKEVINSFCWSSN